MMQNNRLIGKYRNGNCYVAIFDDGTRIIDTGNDTDINLDFPLSLDIACTSYCSGSECPYCYANCGEFGVHAELLSVSFIDTLHPYTEVALQLNDLSHPQLIPFLEKLKSKNIITNMTVNQIHFDSKREIIDELIKNKLIYGLGISLRNATPKFAADVKKYPNAVIHVINGIFSPKDVAILEDNNLKLLILGYKMKGRGDNYYYSNRFQIRELQRWLSDAALGLTDKFNVVSFDNLALEQLDIKRKLSPEMWEQFYQGDDGQLSMYVDLVTKTFGKSSLCDPEEMMPIMDTIEDMFREVKKV